jgi:dTDP-4-amino-4,6-dideoxygalactose transaminase
MPITFLDLRAQYLSLKGDIDAAIANVLDTSTYVLGPSVSAFEGDFAAYCNAQHCIGVGSGTAAIALLLQAHGIGPGDEVITVANTFFATAAAVSELGAIPVLVDCEEHTALIDPALIEQAITPRTKAIIPVHLYGQCADMDAINAIAKRHKLLVIEDACQAHGAMYKGMRAGTLADGAAFSFYPGKNLGAYGEAGAIVTNDPAIAEKVKLLREHGSPQKYHHKIIGWNERMDGIQGAVLGVKLKHLDAWNERRRAIAKLYRETLPSDVQPIEEAAYGGHIYHLFVIRTAKRDQLQAFLKEKGIETIIHYPVPIHLQPAYENRGWKKGDFPASERLSETILSLPISPELADTQAKEIAQAVVDFFAAQ